MRLGWYVRLCIILSLWWLPISSFWLKRVDEAERTGIVISSADICYRGVNSVPIDKFNAEWDRCYNRSKAGFERVSASEGEMWESALGLAVILCLLGWVAAFLLYWSGRFIVAGKNRPE